MLQRRTRRGVIRPGPEGRTGGYALGMSSDSGFDGVLAAAQEGAEWAWELLIRDLVSPLTAFFRARDAADPENLAGEVFLDVANGIRRFEGSASGFRSWVYVIARRRLIDERRRRGRRPEEAHLYDPLPATHREPSAEDEALSRLGGEVQELLGALTSEQRDVLLLRVVAGLSLQETAAVVGKRIGAVKALQRRALIALRKEISTKGVSP